MTAFICTATHSYRLLYEEQAKKLGINDFLYAQTPGEVRAQLVASQKPDVAILDLYFGEDYSPRSGFLAMNHLYGLLPECSIICMVPTDKDMQRYSLVLSAYRKTVLNMGHARWQGELRRTLGSQRRWHRLSHILAVPLAPDLVLS